MATSKPSGLPQQIPEQDVPISQQDASGSQIVDTNWYLFLYNLWKQVLQAPAGAVPFDPAAAIAIVESEIVDTDSLQASRQNVNTLLLALDEALMQATTTPVVPGGSLYSVQSNNPAGMLYGDGNFTYNPTTHTFSLGPSAALIGLYGATPVVQAAAYTQTYSTAARTVPNATAVNLSGTAATQVTPWGFATAAQANDIATEVNALQADVIALKKLINALINDTGATLGIGIHI